MTSRALVLAVICSVMVGACGSSSSPTAPSTSTTTTTTTTTPAQTSFSLSGTITSSAGGAVSGATVTVLDGANAGRTAQTTSTGSYSLTGLSRGGFTMTVTATGFVATSRAITLTADSTSNVALLPSQVFTQSGTGDNVFTLPSYVTRVRVDATYSGSCQNFIVRVSTQTTSLINVIIGTCSVADSRSPFSGTYAIANGGTVTITSSTGINWTFTELR